MEKLFPSLISRYISVVIARPLPPLPPPVKRTFSVGVKLRPPPLRRREKSRESFRAQEIRGEKNCRSECIIIQTSFSRNGAISRIVTVEKSHRGLFAPRESCNFADVCALNEIRVAVRALPPPPERFSRDDRRVLAERR